MKGLGELDSLLFLSSVRYPELPHAMPECTGIDAQQLCGSGRSVDFPFGHLQGLLNVF